MRIGIMLRHMGQHGGGVLTYTNGLLEHLLSLGSPHEFVLMYRHGTDTGRHAAGEHVSELVIGAPSTLVWDQVAVPRTVRREGIDLVFNPKYSIPLGATCRTVFVCHGLDWYVEPRWSRWIDRLSHRYLVPRYAAKADRIIAVSDSTREHLLEYLGAGPHKTRTVYHGVDERFHLAPSDAEVTEVVERLALPERFFLYVGQVYPPKNLGRVLRALAQVVPDHGIPLVLAGEHTWLSKRELGLIDDLGLRAWVRHTGWVQPDVLRVLYRRACGLLLPSLYESFGLPILEAMASGCPVLTADRYGCKEVGAGAALLVDPESTDDIAAGMRRLAEDAEFRGRLRSLGFERARQFSWRRCAEETLRVLEEVA